MNYVCLIIQQTSFKKSNRHRCLKSVVDKLDIGTLEITPVNLRKLDSVVKMILLKNCIGWIKKFNFTQIITTADLV